MRVVVFCHSLVSDWNHGNAHFLRGVVSDLVARGHTVRVYEPRDAWSVVNLIEQQGGAAIAAFERAYPELAGVSTRYDRHDLDLDAALADADVVLVHEWNDHALVASIGAHRGSRGSYVLLFHDTHHRSVTDRSGIGEYDLTYYDGVLAFGDVIRDAYLEHGWTARAWTWHEAADVRVFRPLLGRERAGDLVWIGNWGDGERTDELNEFLFAPARALGLTGSVFGVRYPADAREAMARAGLPYRGWVANHRVPEIFARHAVTVHIPRRPYVEALPGIPTIRPFEALACGIPLVCSRWDDVDGLFTPGEDFLVAHDGDEMRVLLDRVLRDRELARHLAQHGRRTVLERHTCGHRVDELLAVAAELGVETAEVADTAERTVS